MLIGGAETTLAADIGASASTSETAPSLESAEAPSSTSSTDAAYYSSSETSSSEETSYKRLLLLRHKLDNLREEDSMRSSAFSKNVDRTLSIMMRRLNSTFDILNKSTKLVPEDEARYLEIRNNFEEKLAELKKEFLDQDAPSVGRFKSAVQGAYKEFKEELTAFMEPNSDSAETMSIYKPPEGSAVQNDFGSDSNSTMKRLFDAFDKAFDESLSTARISLDSAVGDLKSKDLSADMRDYQRYVAYYQRVVENEQTPQASPVNQTV